MTRFKRTFIILLFTLGFIVIMLVGLLVPFFGFENSYKEALTNVALNINSDLNSENQEEILSYFKSDETKDIIMFNGSGNVIESTDEISFEPNYLFKLKNNLNNVFSFKNSDGRDGLAYCLYNSDSSLYVLTIIYFDSTYIIFKVFVIVFPILLIILSVFCVLFEYFKTKKDASYLKYQVRKLRNIVNIQTMVEYDNDVENLANILKDTRRELDRQLKNNFLSEKKLNFILDSIEQGILVVNLEGVIILSNKKGRDIIKVERNDKKIIEGPLTHDILVNVKVVSSLNRPMLFNKEIDGKIYEFNINNIDDSFNENSSKVRSVSILIVDITEKFNSEKMKRDFFANAAHELKSPLTTILGYQELIKDGVLTTNEEIKTANEKTIKESERMNKLIIEMLELSSLENNNLRPIEKVDVSKELDNILLMLEEQISAKHIKVIKNYEKLILKINNEDFYNLFKNIIENAIRYNKEGGEIVITIDTKNHKISVKDSGIGVSDENKSRIFERFYRVDKARSRENGGTGLGLSIVKYICSYYDYKIDVKSSLGKGSEFTITY